MSKKTPEEIEKLKADWNGDPCFDLENAMGFEEYHDELLAYRKQIEEMRKKQQIARRKYLSDRICPHISGRGRLFLCYLEQCAWWDESNECCVINHLKHLKGAAL